MEHFPIYLRIAGRRCLVVGAGEVAWRKVERLLDAGADVVVVAPWAFPALATAAGKGRVLWERRPYRTADLDGVHLAIAATDDRGVNATVSREAQARRLPVNVVDDPELCSFIVPSIVDRGPVVVAISTGGASPSLARMLRGRVESVVPRSVGALAELLRDRREVVKTKLVDPDRRKAFWERVVSGEVAALALSDRVGHARRLLDELVTKLGADPDRS
jgi:uroporphyrin-III C-methyltransferase/precorrin-2 dehydrogenase/sirohydrochlorin ferrochelatase